MSRTRWLPLACSVAAACGRVHFDPIVGGDATTGTCTTMAFADAFAGTTIDSGKWTILTGTGVAATQNNGLDIAFAANVAAGQRAGVRQLGFHDFRDHCVDFSVTMAPNPATEAYSFGGITTPTGEAIAFEYQLGGLYATYTVPSGSVVVVRSTAGTLYPAMRIRWSGGAYYWELSSDGATFAAFATTTAAGADPADATIVLTAATDSAGATNAGTVVYGFVSELAP